MHIKLLALGILAAIAGCVHVPLGPSVSVMPGPGKPFDLFVAEDNLCRRFAEQQVGMTPQQATEQNVASGAVVGTVIGAAAGTAIGAAAGDIGTGAIVGAGTGLMGGSMAGANAGYGASWTIQERYNISYEQCMYAKGNQIPGFPMAYSPPPLPPPGRQPPPR